MIRNPNHLRMSYHPYAPCPCGKGKKARFCCMPRQGIWDKKPSSVEPPGSITNHSHDRCYAKSLNNCSTKITREHYLSNVILKDMQKTSFIEISGVPWVPTGTSWRTTAKNMTSNILCKRHNNSLSPLDSEDSRFKSVIGQFNANFNLSEVVEEFEIFSGEDIEKWFLKTACGYLSAKIFAQNRTVLSDTVPTLWTKILWGIEPFPKGWGLYLHENQSKAAFQHTTAVSIRPQTIPNTNQIVAVEFTVNGFQFYLLLTTPGKSENFGFYRPRTIIFEQAGVEKVIELSWQDSKQNSFIRFSRIGSVKSS